jgi:hypothetical protein
MWQQAYSDLLAMRKKTNILETQGLYRDKLLDGGGGVSIGMHTLDLGGGGLKSYICGCHISREIFKEKKNKALHYFMTYLEA